VRRHAFGVVLLETHGQLRIITMSSAFDEVEKKKKKKKRGGNSQIYIKKIKISVFQKKRGKKKGKGNAKLER
jgi:hypothetical protein